MYAKTHENMIAIKQLQIITNSYFLVQGLCNGWKGTGTATSKRIVYYSIKRVLCLSIMAFNI